MGNLDTCIEILGNYISCRFIFARWRTNYQKGEGRSESQEKHFRNEIHSKYLDTRHRNILSLLYALIVDIIVVIDEEPPFKLIPGDLTTFLKYIL